MKIETRIGTEVKPALLHNYFDALVNQVYKILPMREHESKTLDRYIRRLSAEVVGGSEFYPHLSEDAYYASLLTLMVEPIAPLYKDIQEGRFKYLTPSQVMDETELFLENVDLKKPCVFRSNHASNYLSLRGDLPADKELMLAQIREARKHSSYKPEFFRAL